MLNIKKLLIALAVAAPLAITGGFSSSANAGYTVVSSNSQKNKDGSTTVHVLMENKDTGKQAIYWIQYHESGKVEGGVVVLTDGTPKPEGGSTGLVDYKAVIEDLMKNSGGELVYVNNFLQTTLGQTLIGHGKTGSIVPYHNPDPLANGLVADPLGDDPFEQQGNQGSSSGGGWYDPMGGSMYEQMVKAGKKNKGKGNKGSGDAGSDAHNPGYDFSADPALVNPVPVQLPVARPNIPAPALPQKGKRTIVKTAKVYPTIPDLPAPAAASTQSAAVGNLRPMRGGIRIGLRPINVRTMRLR